MTLHWRLVDLGQAVRPIGSASAIRGPSHIRAKTYGRFSKAAAASRQCAIIASWADDLLAGIASGVFARFWTRRGSFG